METLGLAMAPDLGGKRCDFGTGGGEIDDIDREGARIREIVARCTFDLKELQYQYPEEAILPGLDPQQSLVKFTWEGAANRYPEGVPDKVRKSLRDELNLIRKMNYAPYFLTVF